MSMLGCLEAAPEQEPFEIPGDDKAGGYKFKYRATEIIPITDTLHGDDAVSDAVNAIHTGPMTYELQGPIYKVELSGLGKMAFGIDGQGFNSSNMGYMVVIMNEAGQWGPIRSLPYTDIAIEAKNEGYPGALPAKDAANRVSRIEGDAVSVNVSSAFEWTLDYKVSETPEYPDGAFRRVFLGQAWTRDSSLTIGLLPTPLSHWWSIEGSNPYETWFIKYGTFPLGSDAP